MLTENGVDARMGNMQLAVGTPTPTLGMLEQPSAIPYGWTDRQTPLLISPNTHQGESSPLTGPQMQNCETQTGETAAHAAAVRGGTGARTQV